MRLTATLIISVILLASCQDAEVYPQDYLSDKGIEVNIRGQVGTNAVDKQYMMRLYETYGAQSIVRNMDGRTYIDIRRFSEDFQSTITFTVALNEAYGFSNATCSYVLTEVRGNKLITVEQYVATPQIDLFDYDQDTGRLVFDYELMVDNDRDQFYTIEGTADVVVYRY